MSEQSAALQNEFLNNLRKERTPVSVFLINGIRLAGHIQSFDQYSIRLHGIRLAGHIQSFDQYSIRLHGTTPQLVLKRVVATVVPERGGGRSKPAPPGGMLRAPRGRANPRP